MPLFVIQWKDKPEEGPSIRAATRQAHLDWMATKPGVLKVGGPYQSEDGAMVGSLLIIEVEDLAAAKALHAEDPYAKAGLFEHSTVDPWRVTVGGLA